MNTNIQFLKEQIDSILNQTYRNFNLLISDDNSTDKKLIKTLKEYEQKDKRIQLYLNKEKKGFLKNF
ncbi:glycosyltransferase, partial [Bacteroides acidifaciens]|uniref:glycosyltransferase n=1 Tax=Bacteroides acidifaciens TaxID=85831 RepID=UPI002598C448